VEREKFYIKLQTLTTEICAGFTILILSKKKSFLVLNLFQVMIIIYMYHA